MYTVTTTTDRPEGTKWFAEVNPSFSKADIDWVKSQSGFISWTSNYDVTKNSYETVLSFVDKESYDAMDSARKSRAEYQARLAHATSNSIVFRKTVS